MKRKWNNVVVIFALAMGILAAALLCGCEISASTGGAAKTFYPDRYGTESYLGDPRRPMFEGSGYTEGNRAGHQSGFQKIGGRK